MEKQSNRRGFRMKKEELKILKEIREEVFSQRKIEDLINKGWKNTNIKYSNYEIYKKDNQRILYDRGRDKVIVKYFVQTKGDLE